MKTELGRRTKNNLFTDSGFRHRCLIELIRRYQSDLEKFGWSEFPTSEYTKRELKFIAEYRQLTNDAIANTQVET